MVTFLDPLGVFQNSPTPGGGVFVQPTIEALPFGVVATFRIRNDSSTRQRWLPRLTLTGGAFEFARRRDRTGTRVDLAPGQTSKVQTLLVSGLPRDVYDVELRLEDERTRTVVSALEQTVRITGAAMPTETRPETASIFFGTVSWFLPEDGPGVPAGTTLSARVGGRRAGRVVIRSPGTFGIGTDTLLVRNAEATPGDPVTFFVDGFMATETAAYDPNGIPRRISLTVPRA